MKKIMISLMLVFITLTSYSQNQSDKVNGNSNVSNQVHDTTAVYKLYPTGNVWTFIKLNTRNGKLWVIQFNADANKRYQSILSLTPRVTPENESNGRFTLYPTENPYNLILLDQKDGSVWQVYWPTEGRVVIPIY